MSNELEDRIQNALKSPVVDRHSFFQLKYFVIGKEPTNQSKMWRCLREIETRDASLKTINLELEEAKDQLNLMRIEIENMEEDIKAANDRRTVEKLEIFIRQKNRKIEKTKAAMEEAVNRKKSIAEEASFFLTALEAIKKVEPLKEFDDLEAQTEYWSEKLRQELNIRGLLSQPVDVELMKTVLALDDKTALKQDVLRQIESAKQRALTAARLEGENGNTNLIIR